MRLWKIIGLAGVIGAVAVGVTVGAKRVQRQRREFVDADIEELRARLRARFDAIGTEPPIPAPG